jgi:hypothetical protein
MSAKVLPYVPDGDVLTDYLWNRDELVCIQGPIQSGTSTASCHRIWVLATEQEPDNDGVRRTRWLVVRSTYKSLRETTMKTWSEWFPDSEWGPMVRGEPAVHHIKRPHPSGDGTHIDCEVIFLAVPDASVAEATLASFEITGFFVNEAQFTDRGVVDELLSRCARYPSMRNGPGATWHGGFLDMNAPLEGTWIPYMRGDVPMPPDWTDDQKALFKKPAGWTFLMQPPGLIEKTVNGQIVYLPNPKAENQKYTRKSYLEIIAGKNKEWIDRRVLNKTGLYLDGKAVYPTFSESDHVAPRPLSPVEGAQIIVGLDFGRDPAAVFCQHVNGRWLVLSELPGDNESAEKFAPRVRKHLASKYAGMKAQFWGDPRGADRGQNVETTAYDIFLAHGMRVLPATTDNNPEMRRSAVGAVLDRRYGIQIDATCLMVKTGLAGGYHYPKIKGTGMFREQPKKNAYSHVVEALENAILGGGEGDAIIRPLARVTPGPSKIRRHKVNLARAR